MFARCICCLYILNSFNISGLDEATRFKFDRWVEYGRVGDKFPPKGACFGSHDRFWYEATLFEFRKCIEWQVPHQRVQNSPEMVVSAT